MRDKLKMVSNMVMVYKFGLMVPSMRVIGKMALLKEKASFFIQLVKFIMENGSKIKLMAMEFIHLWMGLNMKDNGVIISKMVLE